MGIIKSIYFINMKLFNLLAIVALTSAIQLEKYEEAAVQEISEMSLGLNKNGGKVGKKVSGKKVGKKVVVGKKIAIKKRAGGKEEEMGDNSEEAFWDIYDMYDQLAQDFKQCRVYGEALKETAPSQICKDEIERVRFLHQLVAEEA